jgi:hypothetical protein
MDRDHQAHGRAVKEIFVFPLRRDVRNRLRETLVPEPATFDLESD